MPKIIELHPICTLQSYEIEIYDEESNQWLSNDNQTQLGLRELDGNLTVYNMIPNGGKNMTFRFRLSSAGNSFTTEHFRMNILECKPTFNAIKIS